MRRAAVGAEFGRGRFPVARVWGAARTSVRLSRGSTLGTFVRSGMLVYAVGLVLVISAVELVIAFVLSTRGGVAHDASPLFPVYIGAVIALAAVGGFLIPRGLRQLRSPPTAEALQKPRDQ